MCPATFEIRANIKFLVKLQWDQKRILEALLEVYGEKTPSTSCVREWISRFRNGRESLEDDPEIASGNATLFLQSDSNDLSVSAQAEKEESGKFTEVISGDLTKKDNRGEPQKETNRGPHIVSTGTEYSHCRYENMDENQAICFTETRKLKYSEEISSSEEKNMNDLVTNIRIGLNGKQDCKELQEEVEEEEEEEIDNELDIGLNSHLAKEELNKRHEVDEMKIHCIDGVISNRQVAEEAIQLDPVVLSAPLIEENKLDTRAVNDNQLIEDETVILAVINKIESEELDQLHAEELNNRIMAEELKKQLDSEESDRLHAEELHNQLQAEGLNELEAEEEASVAKAMELLHEPGEGVPKEYMYEHLVAVYSEQKFVANPSPFKCPICFEDYKEYEGIILKECLHCFCRECIIQSIKSCDDVDVKCPYRDDDYACSDFISENEILGLLTSEDYNARLTKTLKFAEAQVEFSFHCRKADCTGWCIVEGGLNVFNCPVCSSENCISCKAIHSGYTCSQYADSLISSKSSIEDVKKSETFLQSMVQSGTAMKCPKCSAYVQKMYGCDYLQCSVCKMDLCWATKGPRWGPGGTGDNSGGCGCKVNGRRCHIDCQNCH